MQTPKKLALVGHGKMGRLIGQLAPEYGFQVALALSGKENANASAITLEAFRGKNPDAGGEYLATAFLRDGSIAVVTPIQNPAKQRLGFTWRRFR